MRRMRRPSALHACINMHREFPDEFRPVCRYVMKDQRPQNIEILDHDLWNRSGVVYARVHKGKVVYIGVTDGQLSVRLNAHLRGIGASTRGRASEYRKWAEGRQITIVAYWPEPIDLLGRSVRVHRAIETALIREFERPGECDWFVARA